VDELKLEGFVMTHWWELWSPGLQAIGGVMELVGAGVLAYEWWKGTKEAIEKYQIDAIYLEERGGIRSPEAAFGDIAVSALYLFQHMTLYKVGFALIVAGVVLQVAANSLAWAGAYGIFFG
jgi:hypothetical protein